MHLTLPFIYYFLNIKHGQLEVVSQIRTHFAQSFPQIVLCGIIKLISGQVILKIKFFLINIFVMLYLQISQICKCLELVSYG